MSQTFQPSGVITLTTDIGHKGPFVATMKGVMLTAFPDAKIIDLTHETVAHFPAEAGFWLQRSYRYFPLGTVHVAAVDPGVGTSRNIIAVALDDHVFLAPDNGLLADLAEEEGARIFQLDLRKPDRFGLGEISATFHGRDVLAPIGAALASGRLRPSDLGPETKSVTPSWLDAPEVHSEHIHGVVVAVDNFGNLITNLTRQHVDQFSNATVEAGGHTFPVHRTYGDVKPGDYVALINSFEALELACAERSASDGLGLSRGAPVILRAG